MATGDPDEERMVAALKRGDEQAFTWLVEQHHATLVRLALHYVRDPATAEDVAQDTWLHVLKGLSRFEFRSSLKTWISRILINRARTRGRLLGFMLQLQVAERPIVNARRGTTWNLDEAAPG